MMDFNLFTQQMWHTYFADMNEDGTHPIQNFIDPTYTIIGTGKHEIYQTAQDFQAAMYKEFAERNNIQFQFRDFWCDSVLLSEDFAWYMEKSIFTGKAKTRKPPLIWTAAFPWCTAAERTDGKSFTFITHCPIWSRLTASTIPKLF